MFSSVDLSGWLFGTASQPEAYLPPMPGPDDEANIQVFEIPRRRREIPLWDSYSNVDGGMLLDDDPENPAAGTDRERNQRNPQTLGLSQLAQQWPAHVRKSRALYNDILLLSQTDGVRAEYYNLFTDASREKEQLHILRTYQAYRLPEERFWMWYKHDKKPSWWTKQWTRTVFTVHVAMSDVLDELEFWGDEGREWVRDMAATVQETTGLPAIAALGSVSEGLASAEDAFSATASSAHGDLDEFGGLQVLESWLRAKARQLWEAVDGDWELRHLDARLEKLYNWHSKKRDTDTTYRRAQGAAFDYASGVPFYSLTSSLDYFIVKVYPYLPVSVQENVRLFYVLVKLGPRNTVFDPYWRTKVGWSAERVYATALARLEGVLVNYFLAPLKILGDSFLDSLGSTLHLEGVQADAEPSAAWFTNVKRLEEFEIRALRKKLWRQLQQARLAVYGNTLKGMLHLERLQTALPNQLVYEQQGMLGGYHANAGQELSDEAFVAYISQNFIHSYASQNVEQILERHFNAEQRQVFIQMQVYNEDGTEKPLLEQYYPAVLVELWTESKDKGQAKVYMAEANAADHANPAPVLRLLYAMFLDDLENEMLASGLL